MLKCSEGPDNSLNRRRVRLLSCLVLECLRIDAKLAPQADNSFCDLWLIVLARWQTIVFPLEVPHSC